MIASLCAVYDNLCNKSVVFVDVFPIDVRIAREHKRTREATSLLTEWLARFRRVDAV